MNFYLRQVVIIEAGAPQALVVQAKAQRLDQVQRRAGVGAQPDGIAGIPGNLRFEQHDMEHLFLDSGAVPFQENQLRGIGKLDVQATQFFDDAEIHRLLQIEHRIHRGLLHEIGELELK